MVSRIRVFHLLKKKNCSKLLPRVSYKRVALIITEDLDPTKHIDQLQS